MRSPFLDNSSYELWLCDAMIWERMPVVLVPKYSPDGMQNLNPDTLLRCGLSLFLVSGELELLNLQSHSIINSIWLIHGTPNFIIKSLSSVVNRHKDTSTQLGNAIVMKSVLLYY